VILGAHAIGLMKRAKPAASSESPQSRLSMVSLFSGAGGLDVGLEQAGFRRVVSVEVDSIACETLGANRNSKQMILNADIHHLRSEDLCEKCGLDAEEVTMLVGGPPCQPFSKAAYWKSGDTKRLRDPRADTLKAYLRILRDLKPRIFLLENVSGLAFSGKDEGIRLLRNAVGRINRETGTNYSFNLINLNAANFGVPQTRERVFIVGERDGKTFNAPTATHFELPGSGLHRMSAPAPRWASAWDAIGDLEEDASSVLLPKGKWAELLKSIPEGQNYLWHTNRGGGVPLFGWRRRYWGFLLKLSKDRPSWTLQAQPGPATGPFHWRSRRLSILEMRRLQTFPDGYHIAGTWSEAAKQIGNAVPCLLAEVLGREVRRQLLGARAFHNPPAFLVPPREGMPGREPVRRVPSKYRHLIGDHSAHPGTGKGFSSINE
jgi:DNA (cytosine-5)-methyltransferase 1